MWDGVMAKLWCGDEETWFNQLVLLTGESIVVANTSDDDVAPIRERLESGENPAAVLSSDALTIPFLSVTKISTDKHDEDIDISYKVGSETKSKTLRLKNPEKRDEVYAELKQVYGEKFQEAEDRYNVLRAAFGSLMGLTIFGGLTWLAVQASKVLRAAGDYEVEGSRAGLKKLIGWILETLGPTGCTIVGGLICALIAWNLVNRVKQPPEMLILQEGPYKSASMVGLTMKYSILLFIWYVVARAFM
jgi:hypothetical protein